MAAAKYNFDIEQGSTFNPILYWKTGKPATPIDLTGCKARMQVRKAVNSTDTVADLTTENGGIVLGGVNGTIQIIIAASVTSTYLWNIAVYDLEIIFADLSVRRLLSGNILNTPEVTR